MSRVRYQEWKQIAKTLDANDSWDQIEQQGLFRLIQALSKDEWTTAQQLLEKGVGIDGVFVCTEKGIPGATQWGVPQGYPTITALGWAAACHQTDALEWLLCRDANPNALFAGGRDALWAAVEHQKVLPALRLLGYGASVHRRLPAPQGKNHTILIEAVKARLVDVVERLLQRKANPLDTDMAGCGALEYNFRQTPYEPADAQIARLLLDAGANPNQENLQGVRAHAFATSPEAQALLERHQLLQSIDVPAEAPVVETAQTLDDILPGVPQIKRPLRKRM